MYMIKMYLGSNLNLSLDIYYNTHHVYRYKCHKNCAVKAPPSCGLPQGLIDFYRKQVLLSSQSPAVDQVSPVEPHSPRPKLEKSHTYDSDTREQFPIQDLTKEPKNGAYMPVCLFAGVHSRLYMYVLVSTW